MPRWFRITLWALAILLGLLAALYAWILHDLRNSDWDFSNADKAHYAASEDFYAALGTPNCLTLDAITVQADNRSWDWIIEPTFQWQNCPAAASPWLRVTIEPSLFMSTDNENAAFFVFDGQGCSIDWRDANTCND